MLAKLDQIYIKALQRINIMDVGIGSYTITIVNSIRLKGDLEGW